MKTVDVCYGGNPDTKLADCHPKEGDEGPFLVPTVHLKRPGQPWTEVVAVGGISQNNVGGHLAWFSRNPPLFRVPFIGNCSHRSVSIVSAESGRPIAEAETVVRGPGGLWVASGCSQCGCSDDDSDAAAGRPGPRTTLLYRVDQLMTELRWGESSVELRFGFLE